MRSRILKGWRVFDKYYSMITNSPYYAAALVLHPENRIQYIRTNWIKARQKPAEDATRLGRRLLHYNGGARSAARTVPQAIGYGARYLVNPRYERL